MTVNVSSRATRKAPAKTHWARLVFLIVGKRPIETIIEAVSVKAPAAKSSIVSYGSGVYSFDTQGSDFDTVLHTRSICDNPEREIITTMMWAFWI